MFALACSFITLAPAADRLASAFENPPPSARPWVYWFIMDGNLTREGITADFEAMQRAGIGGMIMMEVDAGVPKGPVAFMSREWRELFAHAVKEAKRLGLQITVNAGPGWTGSGGPWVKAERSMQHLVASAVEVSGPARYSVALPLPKRRPAFFGDGGLPPELERARNEFYRDVAVLAFPAPQREARIPDIDEKALYVRAPYSSQPGVKASLPTSGHYEPDPPESVIPRSSVVDVTKHLAADGRLEWDVPAGKWTILRFGSRSTGANTRPAPTPGIGLESDKFDRAALDAHFEAFVRSLLKNVGTPNQRDGSSPGASPEDKAGWTSLHIDSWEMGAQNWSASFRNEFKKRRGYDPLTFYPVLTGRVVGTREISERFLWDWRQTAQELVVSEHAEHLKELGRREGLGLSIEPYDMNPCADLTLGGAADVPMCEFWLYGFNTSFSVIESTSIAHTLGRRVVAAEAFTSTDSERWQAHPGSMRALGDWAFCAGVNRLVFHRYQHQPRLDRRPGMTMGPYGVHWERTQTWWDLVPAYHQYLARCQFLLRQGLPVADVCFLAKEGAPHVFRPPPGATRGSPPDRLGYNFDACAPETLRRFAVKDGKLVLPDGMTYRVLVLPDSETITPELLGKVQELVKAGATVLGPKPSKSPSLANYPECDAAVGRMASELWGKVGSAAAGEHRLGHGRVVSQVRLSGGREQSASELTEPPQYGDFSVVERVLTGMGVVQDFQADRPVRYIHRRAGGTEIYFVANPENQPVTAECTFRVQSKQPELWDPVTGQVRRLTSFSLRPGTIGVPLRFAPHQSWFVIFRSRISSPATPVPNFVESGILSEIAGPWEVSFDPASRGPGKITFEQLEDWTKRPEPEVRHYSGMATYRKQFDLPSSWTAKAGTQLFLDLGSVKNLAKVCLNGHDLGVLWCEPWRMEITGRVQARGNLLEVTVVNLWVNRLIGDSALSDAERVTWTTWNPFKPGTPLLPSGLLGPVRIESLLVSPEGGG